MPVLFTGTMRSNLDPFERHSDVDIWAALRRAHLARVVESNPMGLEMALAEGGAPLSAGQKQLVALARALLRNSKVGRRSSQRHMLLHKLQLSSKTSVTSITVLSVVPTEQLRHGCIGSVIIIGSA